MLSQAHFMWIVHNHPWISTTEIRQHFPVGKSSVLHIANDLIKKGLVVKRRVARLIDGDHRFVNVYHISTSCLEVENCPTQTEESVKDMVVGYLSRYPDSSAYEIASVLGKDRYGSISSALAFLYRHGRVHREADEVARKQGHGVSMRKVWIYRNKEEEK